MVAERFNRSFSLPGPPRLKARPAPQKSYHVRSISLPCRSHPLISQIEHDIQSIKSWQSVSVTVSASSLCDGLTRLEVLHANFNDLINLPQNQETLRRGSKPWTGRILDDFLRFAVAHGGFRTDMVALNELQSDAQVAVRLNDTSKLASCSRSIKMTEKDLVRLASSLRELTRLPLVTKFANTGADEAELAGLIREVVSVTAAASAAVFLGVLSVSSTVSVAKTGRLSSLRRLTASRSYRVNVAEDHEGERGVMERLENVEECVREVESRSHRLFRCLLNTRVSLLNILTC